MGSIKSNHITEVKDIPRTKEKLPVNAKVSQVKLAYIGCDSYGSGRLL